MMFSSNKDRVVVEVVVEFNISAIAKWLNSGGNLDDIDGIERKWRDVVVQSYAIDMFPVGRNSNAYYHRNKGIISQNIGGVDFLHHARDQVRHLTEEAAQIGMLSWDMWRGCLSLTVQGNDRDRRDLIMLTPLLTEVAELEATGKVSQHENASEDLLKRSTEEIEIDAPYSFDDANHPKAFIKVWRTSSNSKSLSYGNALGRVSFSTRNPEVMY